MSRVETMHVAFRTDASIAIGTGHVMRCLTLADALRERGAVCRFICREHPGNLIDAIRNRGYGAHILPPCEHAQAPQAESLPRHAAWLGCDWQTDATQTASAMADRRHDWLVVDHYALDARWESALREKASRIFAIDDLADRPHDADLLLDQNLGRERADYTALVPAHCTVLTGPQYALLRPEFAKWREYSLSRRKTPRLRQILVTMGGIDAANATGAVLSALAVCDLPRNARIIVVMGGSAPWLPSVREVAQRMPWPTEVRVDIDNMAEVMANTDLAIGAAGSTSWERCCLGLPALLVALAENQRPSAHALHAWGAALLLGGQEAIAPTLSPHLAELSQPGALAHMTEQAAALTDGTGNRRLARFLFIDPADGA